MMRVSSAMAAADFQRLSRNAAASPLFVLPLAKPPPAGATAMQKLRIVTLGFGTARQEMALE
jgi:hypothetical protein